MTQESRDARRDPPLTGSNDDQALDDALDDLEQMLGKKAAGDASTDSSRQRVDNGIDLGDTSVDDWTDDSTLAGLDEEDAPTGGHFAALRQANPGAGGRDDETMTDLIGAGSFDEPSFNEPSLGPPLTRSEDSPGDLQSPDEDRIWSDALTDRVAQRLASEIEVITQTCLEQSLERVAAQVREQIHAHINIVLPEILEEMAREEFDDPDDFADLDRDASS